MPEPMRVIAVVDDDKTSRRALSRVLAAAGVRADAFPSAETLLLSGVLFRAECLVLDVHLQGMSGLDLRRELLGSGIKQAPVIFITGDDEPGIRAQAEALGASACLRKPVTGGALVAAVTQAIAGTV